MIIAKRNGTSPAGFAWSETISRDAGDTFTVAVRSTDADDNFDATLSLRELFDYMGEAIMPFEKTVI